MGYQGKLSGCTPVVWDKLNHLDKDQETYIQERLGWMPADSTGRGEADESRFFLTVAYVIAYHGYRKTALSGKE